MNHLDGPANINSVVLFASVGCTLKKNIFNSEDKGCVLEIPVLFTFPLFLDLPHHKASPFISPIYFVPSSVTRGKKKDI